MRPFRYYFLTLLNLDAHLPPVRVETPLPKLDGVIDSADFKPSKSSRSRVKPFCARVTFVTQLSQIPTPLDDSATLSRAVATLAAGRPKKALTQLTVQNRELPVPIIQSNARLSNRKMGPSNSRLSNRGRFPGIATENAFYTSEPKLIAPVAFYQSCFIGMI
ncbi:hypothetical protein ARMGADRAFT_1040019 [Armillaria gallica]|uniref:Uncharacterized protein n=1 Tax=Armillaria gallica TaxID=47427 RepID=A0A2H3CUQ4_ARMGA|nr:hypothetical protein ARMGADRAFT_1040019 [Armillaria gallica]